MGKIDAIDRKILRRIQSDAAIGIGALADEVGLSSNACWKRMKRLEAENYVERKVAILNRHKLNLKVIAFVTVRTDQHDEKWLERFAAAISLIPEIVEFYRMSGEVDYILKVVCKDIEDYDRIYKKIIRSISLRDISAFFAMEQIKATTEIPLDSL